MEIRLTSTTPVSQHTYKLSIDEKSRVREIVKDLMSKVGNKGSKWSDALWRMQTSFYAVFAPAVIDRYRGSYSADQSVRDVALNNSNPNREALLVLRRQRASHLLALNQQRQDTHVNRGRRQPRVFTVGSLVFVRKTAQITGKLDSGMRGPYRVIRALPHHRYELQLLAGSHGKKTQAAAENMMLWRGEWTPDACSVVFETEIALNNSYQVGQGSDVNGVDDAAARTPNCQERPC
ncbi:hypothetical protein B5X24_HaOG214694 [Helicoverpa armigera]|nr:hypothetical protein B5X24_HaOG214694 [Helicoverpa armigera]